MFFEIFIIRFISIYRSWGRAPSAASYTARGAWLRRLEAPVCPLALQQQALVDGGGRGTGAGEREERRAEDREAGGRH